MAQRSLKVDCGGDIRRILLSWGEEASDSEIHSSMLTAIQTAFGLDESVVRNAVLKYKDDEGDFCTLTGHTLHDFLALSGAGVLRLSMELVTPTEGDAADVAMPSQEGCSAQDVADMEDEPEASSATGAPQNMGFAMFLLPMLPKAAQYLQANRGDVNALALRKRQMLLPVCQRLVELAGRVPESQYLVPQLEAFVSGADTEHFGDTAALLLQAWADSQSKEAVQQVLPAVVQELMAAGSALRSGGVDEDGLPCMPPDCEGGATDGDGTCSAQDAQDFAALLGMLGGQSAASSTGASAGTGSAPCDANLQGAPNFASLLGGLLAGKGGGKGGGKGAARGNSTAPGAPDLAALCSMFGGPAMANGMGGGTGAAGGNTTAPGAPDLAALCSMFGGPSMANPTGAGMAPGSANPPGAPDLASALGGLLGGAFGAKGGGKGSDFGPALGGLFANIMAAKGKGKGAGGAPPEWAPPSPSAAAAPPPPPPSPQQQDPGDCSAAAMAAQLDASVAELLEMGLVEDAETARSLLLAHHGDIAQVVAALCPDD